LKYFSPFLLKLRINNNINPNVVKIKDLLHP